MNGNYGCLPDNAQVFTSKKNAIEYLSSIFGLDKKQVKELEKCMYLSIPQQCSAVIDLNPQKYGAQYCEIVIENMSKSEIEEYNY